MPLNNSGPLSFGGTTVGQSINLELGVSATATASINSTAFRNLAGVPSGQISLSNFYGKSNITYYVAKTQRSTSNSVSFSKIYNTIDPSGNVYSWGGTQWVNPCCQFVNYNGGIIKTNSEYSQSAAIGYSGGGFDWQYVNITYDTFSNTIVGVGRYAGSFTRMVKFNSSLGVSSQSTVTTTTLNGYGARMYEETGVIGTDSSGNVYVVLPVRVIWYCSNWDFTLVYKTDSAMTSILWSRYQGLAYNNTRPMRTAHISPTGVAYVFSQPPVGGRDVLSVFTSAGALSWSLDINDGNQTQWDSVTSDSSGNIYIAGYNQGASPSYATIAKLNSSGTVQWTRRVRKVFSGVTTYTGSVTPAVDSSGNVYLNFLAGASPNSTPKQWITAKFDSSGATQWVRYYEINLTGSNEGWYLRSPYNFKVSPSNQVPYQVALYQRSGGWYGEMLLSWPTDGSKTGTYSVPGGDYTETLVLGVSDAEVNSYSPSWTYTDRSANANNAATMAITSGGNGFPLVTSSTTLALGIQTRVQLV